jgi:diguanylate cyclase (GGDEF)-like protein/PAS domain S-box-containing protein
VALTRSAWGGRIRPDSPAPALTLEAAHLPRGLVLVVPGVCSSVPGLTPSPRGPEPEFPEAPLADLAFEAAPVALAVAGTNGRLLRVNRAFCELLGYPAEELVGLPYEAITDPEDLHLDQQAMAGLLGKGRGPAVEKRFRHAGGHSVWARVTATLIRTPQGGLQGAAVVAVEDIAEIRRRHAELSRLALHDPLTGVRNRVQLDQDIERALRARDRSGGVVAVLYVDVDDFKGINDAHGHEAGDMVLILLTSRLREAVRDQDTVARLGGDEFVLVSHLPSAELAEDLRARVEQVCAEPMVLDAQVLPVRISVGMAVVASEGWTPAAALALADSAMYAVKRSRKSRPGTAALS